MPIELDNEYMMRTIDFYETNSTLWSLCVSNDGEIGETINKIETIINS